MTEDARVTLQAAGFSRAEATRAVRTAIGEPREADDRPPKLETIVRAALRALRPAP